MRGLRSKGEMSQWHVNCGKLEWAVLARILNNGTSLWQMLAMESCPTMEAVQADP